MTSSTGHFSNFSACLLLWFHLHFLLWKSWSVERYILIRQPLSEILSQRSWMSYCTEIWKSLRTRLLERNSCSETRSRRWKHVLVTKTVLFSGGCVSFRSVGRRLLPIPNPHHRRSRERLSEGSGVLREGSQRGLSQRFHYLRMSTFHWLLLFIAIKYFWSWTFGHWLVSKHLTRIPRFLDFSTDKWRRREREKWRTQNRPRSTGEREWIVATLKVTWAIIQLRRCFFHIKFSPLLFFAFEAKAHIIRKQIVSTDIRNSHCIVASSRNHLAHRCI